MAHPLPTEREVWAFSVTEYALVAVAAVIAAPFMWVATVLALTVLA
jgi:hypothetical protein